MSKKLWQQLQTKKVKEQEDRVADMISVLNTPVVTVTVLFDKGLVKLGIVANQDVTFSQIKNILNQGLDYVTRQAVMAEMEQQAPPDGMEMPVPEDGQGNDSEVPDNVIPDGPDGGDFSS